MSLGQAVVQGIRSLPSDLAVAWRTDGRAGLRALLPIGRLYIRRHFLVIEQELREVIEVAPPPGVEIEPAGEDCARLRPILRSRQLALFDRRLAAGRTCLIATREGRPVGYTWISERVDLALEHHPLALPPDAAYLWDLFVVKDERGSGIGSALVSARLALARSRGHRVGWRLGSPDNRASLRTAEKTGKVKIFLGILLTGNPRLVFQITLGN